MNPCLKTGITVQTDDGMFIHGDLFLNEHGVQVRGAREMFNSSARPAEAVVRVNEVSTRGSWIDYTVDLLSMTPALVEYLSRWSGEAVEMFKSTGVEIK